MFFKLTLLHLVIVVRSDKKAEYRIKNIFRSNFALYEFMYIYIYWIYVGTFTGDKRDFGDNVSEFLFG